MKPQSPVEATILNEVMLYAGSRPTCRVFRNSVGFAYIGTVVSQTPGTITLKNYRPVHFGLCKGSSDLIGFKSAIIKPEHVGSKVAVFTALECKTNRGTLTPEQSNFISIVQSFGGLAGVARSTKDAEAILYASKLTAPEQTHTEEVDEHPLSSQ